MQRDEIQAQIAALIAQRDALADKVEDRGLTGPEELDLFVIEHRIEELKRQL
jgi:hypothetical protein